MGDAFAVRTIPRRKQVAGAYRPNSFRVLTSEEDDVRITSQPVSSFQRTNILGQPVASSTMYDHWSYGRPAPPRSKVLLSNVKTMMGPVTDVQTKDKVDPRENGSWLTHPHPEMHEPDPPHALDSSSRDHYRRPPQTPGNTRHSANPNNTPATGAVPVTWLRNPPPLPPPPPEGGGGGQRTLREKISFEHQYNARLHPNYPPRGKRQGHFVWDALPDERVDQFLLSRFGHSNRLTPPAEKDIEK